MDDHVFLSWQQGRARLKGYSSANRGKITTVKIELEVLDPYTLGDLVRELQTAQAKNAPLKTQDDQRG